MQREKLRKAIFPSHGGASEAPRLDRPREPSAWKILALESWHAQLGDAAPPGPRKELRAKQLSRQDILRAYGLEESALAALSAKIAGESAEARPLEKPEGPEWEIQNAESSDEEGLY